MAGAKSITEYRALAQNMGCKWSFSDDIKALKQKIELRQTEILPPPPIIHVPMPEDQRLRSKPPAKVSDEAMIRTMLAPYIERGLHVAFTEDGQFHFRHGEKMDTGTLRQPPRSILDCAARVLG
jgi:hypothetical protein